MGWNRFGYTLADVEREHILETLSACDGNRTRTARLLDISIRCLRMKLHRFGQSGLTSGSDRRRSEPTRRPHRQDARLSLPQQTDGQAADLPDWPDG